MTTREARLRAAAAASAVIDAVDLTPDESAREMALLTEALGPGFVGAGTAALTDDEKVALLASPLYSG